MSRTEKIWLVSLALALVVSMVMAERNPLTASVREGEPIRALLVGTDEVDNAKHADTIIFASYEPVRKTMVALSIPRDTRVDIPGIRVHKITEVYAYGYHKRQIRAEGCEALKSEVERMLDIRPIPFYVEVDYQGFRNLIDLLGGVPVKVDQPMDYDDNWGKLHIHFAPGEYVLDGARSLEYLRFRDETGDLGRVLRQQMFLKSLLERLKSPRVLIKLPAIGREIVRHVTTNLTLWDVLSALYEAKDLNRRNLDLQSLPGTPARNGQWIPDTAALLKVRHLILTGSYLSEEAPGAAASGPEAVLSSPENRIRAEVWNASGRPRLAKTARRDLLKAGVDVVKWGSYAHVEPVSQVVNRGGNLRAAQRVADALNCSTVITRIDDSRFVDVTVILGSDYDGGRRSGRPDANR